MAKPVGTSIRSVEKAMSIVRVLAQAPGGATLSDIAGALGQNDSTTHHLISTLREGGFVKQDEVSRVYRLGDGLVQLVTAFLSTTDLFSIGSGPAMWLRERTGESAYLNDYRGIEPVTLMELPGWNPIQVRRANDINRPQLHCTSTGKLFLAYMDAERRDRVLAATTFYRFTANTLSDREALERELVDIRKVHYALDREEHRTGIRCIAVPFFNHHRIAVGSVSLSFPAGRSDETSAFLPLVAEVAQRISIALGHPGATVSTPPVEQAS